MKITSVNNPLIKDMTKLHKKKYRDQTSLFLVEGYHLYEEAKKGNNIVHVFTTDETIKGEHVIYVSNQVLEKLTQTKHPQPVLTVCNKIKSKKITNRVLLLEEIQDPGNLGTLMRSALAFGFHTIVLDNTVDIYNDKVLRSTQGAIFKLNIIEQPIIEFMELNKDFLYYGTSMNGDPLSRMFTQGNIGVILGNEGSGVSEKVQQKTKMNVTIKMRETESLNVGVAGSIIMHHIDN